MKLDSTSVCVPSGRRVVVIGVNREKMGCSFSFESRKRDGSTWGEKLLSVLVEIVPVDIGVDWKWRHDVQ